MANSSLPPSPRSNALGGLANFIFWSRWLQMPLYIGLIVAQAVYVFHFWVELVHLVEAVFGNQEALRQLVESVGYKVPPILDAAGKPVVDAAGQVMLAAPKLNETLIMLVVLALIDVVMISNLLIMVIVGGYETFVSRLGLQDHPDQPEWLSHVNASVLKVKLATAIIGISSIHLLKTFISAANYDEKVLIWQTLIHMAFLFSAMAIAACDRILPQPIKHNAQH
ncbi:MAG: TIGR00645 family protein [Betaproteobacteria bacterium]